MAKRRNQAQDQFGPIILIIIGVLLIAFTLWQLVSRSSSSAQSQNADPTLTTAEIERVSLEDARQALEDGEAVFVDVRSKSNYDISHVDRAISIPLNELANRQSELDPDQWVIPYCT